MTKNMKQSYRNILYYIYYYLIYSWLGCSTPNQLLICSSFSRENGGQPKCSWLLITKHQLDSVLLQYLISLVAFLRVYFKGITGWLLCKASFCLHLHANELGKNLLGKKEAAASHHTGYRWFMTGSFIPPSGGRYGNWHIVTLGVISETILPK